MSNDLENLLRNYIVSLNLKGEGVLEATALHLWGNTVWVYPDPLDLNLEII